MRFFIHSRDLEWFVDEVRFVDMLRRTEYPTRAPPRQGSRARASPSAGLLSRCRSVLD